MSLDAHRHQSKWGLLGRPPLFKKEEVISAKSLYPCDVSVMDTQLL